VTRIAVAGNLSLDDTITPTGSQPKAAGGDALYASLGVAWWGGRPEMITLVGDDYPPAHLARMVAAGIDVSHVRPVAGPTVHYRVIYEADGSRVFEWLGDEERLLLTSPVAGDYAALPAAAWLHVAAMPIESQEIAVAAAREAGLPCSLDPHEEYVVGVEDRLAALVRGAFFLPSELEVRLLFRDLDDLDPVAFGFRAAERLDAWAPAGVAIKLGALGSIVRVDGASRHVPAPAANVVDPTGAGDAYCGGFVVGFMHSASALVAAACGTAAAEHTIGTFGAFGAPPPPAPERLRRLRSVLELAEPEGLAATTIEGVTSLERHLMSTAGIRA
jgi:sugar/nucleoside kinase (ribokinase family)